MVSLIFEFFKKLNWILSAQFGIDLKKLFKSILGMSRFFYQLIHFYSVYPGRIEIRPCFGDHNQEGGDIRNEYFWQDLHVAKKIFIAGPLRHVDIGSRIDGFVAHVASFREIELFDIRPITSNIEGVVFKQADLVNDPPFPTGYCDSLSCLHALEHFGLGRYGDAIDPMGSIAGFKNMSLLLKPGGIFYLSVPIGIERVEFNAHRIFNPFKLVELAIDKGLNLQDFVWFEQGKGLIQSKNPRTDMLRLVTLRYSLGIFTFQKN
jgi:hypothetical protein